MVSGKKGRQMQSHIITNENEDNKKKKKKTKKKRNGDDKQNRTVLTLCIHCL